MKQEKKKRAYPRKRFKSQIMPLDRLNLPAAREPSVAIHDEGNMLRHRTLTKCPDEELSQSLNGPFDGRRLEQPLAQMEKVQRRHDCGLYRVRRTGGQEKVS